MKINVFPTSVVLLTMLALLGCASQQPNIVPATTVANASNVHDPAPYIIHPGDQLDIKFFYNPELNETLTVRPDGMISLQLVDEVQAAGREPSQLDDELTEKYARELKMPSVTVIVKSFSGQRIFVGGEVNRQGVINISGAMTPLQAVLDAGGFKETASPENAIIIRKGAGNRPVPIAVNLSDAMQGDADGSHLFLQPDDIVYVPKSAIARANKFVNEYIENLLLFRGVSLGFRYDLNDSNRD